MFHPVLGQIKVIMLS